jgi:LmbE family N-acetylglucosaminyl deacetylase
MRQKTLLGIFAHPDDESFGPGGTLARYAAEGARVHVIIATDGMAGSVEDESYRDGTETLAQVRSTELSNAAVLLGLTSIWSLPYRDSGMRGSPDNGDPQALIQQPIEALSAELIDYMQRFQPEVVLTHDPFGGYGHPDHVRCCEATTTAFYSLRARSANSSSPGYAPQKLYYTAFDKTILKFIVRGMELLGRDTVIGRNRDINLAEIAQWETPVHAKVDVSAYLTEKGLASMAHASQYSGGPSYIKALPGFLRQRFLHSDAFTRAYPAPNGQIESDLFAGVR